jgi:hypothetical protein
MSEPTRTSATTPAPAAALPWTAPVCTEYAVADLTAFNASGSDDSFGLS